MRTADFTPESPGRLVEIPPGVPAFVPDPMPAELALDHVAIRLLTDAEHGGSVTTKHPPSLAELVAEKC